jgi:CRISPR type III-B/RAMP module RAMP protein Cmr1
MLDTISQTFVTVTPMFLYGDQNRLPELRAASLRGALRWWFRAVAGGYVKDVSDIRKYEGMLFGGTGDKEGASAVNVRVLAHLTDDHIREDSPVPHKNMVLKGIAPGVVFRIDLTPSPYSNIKLAKETAEALLILVSVLGGLGRRSRRGYGAFQPYPPRNAAAEDQLLKEDHLGDWVKMVVEKARSSVQAFINANKIAFTIATYTTSDRAPFPILAPNVACIQIGIPSTLSELFTDGGKHNLIWQIHLKSESEDLLPKVLGKVQGGRQASTMCISIISLAQHQVVPVFTQFYCDTCEHPQRTEFQAIYDFPQQEFGARMIWGCAP